MKKTLLILLFFSAILTVNSFAQYQWQVYTTYNSGLPNNDIGRVVFDDNNVKWIGTSGGLAKYNGTSWIVYDTGNSPLPNQSIPDLAFENNVLWIATYGGGIARFDGTNWTIYDTLNSPLPSNRTEFILVENHVMWIGTIRGLAKYDGNTWTIYNTSNSGIPANFLWCGVLENNIKWIGTLGSGVGKFDNTSWTVYNYQNSGLPSDAVRGITVDYLGNKWIATMFGGVAKFNSNSNIWTVYNTTNSGLPYNNCNSIYTQNNIKWIGCGYLARFDDTSWYVFTFTNSPLPGDVTCLSSDRLGNLWIGTDGGLAEYNPNGIVIGIKNETENIPGIFSLKQNYPNPFNPSTFIEYELKKNVYVSIKIYNLLGKLISDIAETRQRAGNYKLQFNAENLPSGVYYYVMEARQAGSSTGSYKETKKMVLIK